jgi:triphosphatase
LRDPSVRDDNDPEMKDEPREVELKFNLDPTRGAEILAWLGQGRRPTSRTLTSIYFDTATHDLRKAGYALRVRSDGENWIQTVKSRDATGGKLGRGEWEASVAGPAPDLAHARHTPAKTCLGDHVRVTPMFTVEVRRNAVDIRMPDSVIEACVDCGAVKTSDRSNPMDEVELELKAGRPEALFSLASRLRETFSLGLSVVTKADRGFALMEGRSLAPRHFQAPTVTSRMTAGEAFRAMARAALDQVLWNAELVASAPSIEAIHQMRVGARRLRATLSTFKAVVADDQLAGVKTRLKWLSSQLDPARNLDVYIEGARGRTVTTESQTLEAARAAEYERVRAAVTGEPMRTLLLDTLIWIETGAWTADDAEGAHRRDRPVKRFAATALEKARRRMVETGAHFGRLSTETRHRLRIQAKALRYGADVFDQLFDDHPKRVKRFLSALETLLENLGELNDIATARVVAAGFAHNPDLVAGQAARESELLAMSEGTFKAFKTAKPYWQART